MQRGSIFAKVLFGVFSLFSAISLTTTYFSNEPYAISITIGALGGLVLCFLFYLLDLCLNKSNLRTFNTALLGLFIGYLAGHLLSSIAQAVSASDLTSPHYLPVQGLIYLVSIFTALSLTMKNSENLCLILPFIELKPQGKKKKDILVDLSILFDSRIIDLASSGLLDGQLIIPRYAMKELYVQTEVGDEVAKSKARKGLEVIKKLTSLTSLDLRYTESDLPEIKDPNVKLIQMARALDTHIITSDINRIQQSSIEGVRIINVHMLSNALKPLTQSGETIQIKIQRYGKEPRQGVGYLDDGTMVVVNGGAEFIGETIKAYVLSVKHTTSGRLIFCNAAEEGCGLPDLNEGEYHSSSPVASTEVEKNYLTL